MARSKYLDCPVGSLYGKWCAVGYSHYANEHYWNVSCLGCGLVFSRRASQLVLGRSRGCQSCNSKEREKYSFWEGIDGISKQYLTKLSFRGKEVNLKLQDLVDQWHIQQGKCAYSNIPLILVQKDSKWSSSTASIDRIDSAKGYVLGNIQWVHKKINIMKNDMKEEEFVNFCNLVVTHKVKEKGGSCGI